MLSMLHERVFVVVVVVVVVVSESAEPSSPPAPQRKMHSEWIEIVMRLFGDDIWIETIQTGERTDGGEGQSLLTQYDNNYGISSRNELNFSNYGWKGIRSRINGRI